MFRNRSDRAPAQAAAVPAPTELATAAGRSSRYRSSTSALLGAIVLAASIAIGNFVGWDRAHPTVFAPDFYGQISGLAYNAFGRWDSPLEKKYPEYDSIENDMGVLARHTTRVRTYSSNELPVLPALAEQHQLYLTAGVWLDAREDNNEKEIRALEQAVRINSSIERVIVGNEQILHGAFTPAELILKIREVKRRARKPVSTAEPWHVWLRYPELAANVDFITVHLLPYWEGLPVKDALEYSFDRLRQVEEKFPNKKIVIGEVGWPSQGDRRMGSYASPANQAQFIREFLVRAQARNLDYFLMEAIDQPWKIDNEGRAGPYWGIMNAERTPKFSTQGPIETDAGWRTKAALSSTIGMIALFLFMLKFYRLRLPSRIAFGLALQAVVSLFIWLLAIPFDYYMQPMDWVFVAILGPSLIAMSAILLANGFEFAEMFWPGNLKRRFGRKPLAAGARQPKVSLHLACCNEPAEMVIATIRSLARLDYSNFEVLVIDNNTRDDRLWKPVQEFMATLDDRFKFFHLPKWPGYKAGALNFALKQTDPHAEIVGVVDADYVVVSRWLKDLVGHFDDPKTAVVQCPQAHRTWGRQIFRRMMNYEYDGFFRIGMHHRNERNAIIQHGTMTLVRAQALKNHGNWSEWCICEDAELGLRLMDAGYSAVYVDEVMGRGLTPDTFYAFKKQRRRWAQGAIQILKAHTGTLFGRSNVDAGQRYHFVAGWFSWIGDALHLVFAFGAMAWTIGIVGAPHLFSLPIQLFMIPLMVFFVCKALMGPLLYLRRVRCSLPDVMGSALAGMALSHGIAQGVFAGLWHKTAVFEITEKGAGDSAPAAADASALQMEAARPAAAVRQAGPAWAGVREEALLLIGLLFCVAAMAWTRLPNHLESAMWMTILVLQAVPYAAALSCAGLSALPEFRTRTRPRHSLQTAAASAGPRLLATARVMSGVNDGGGTPSGA
ncbi:MAG: glycosyltransferase [Lautropia sp.]|nr:glycosyltransferase [Lautropia sp.]